MVSTNRKLIGSHVRFTPGGSCRQETHDREGIVDDRLPAVGSQEMGQLFPFGYSLSASAKSRRHGFHFGRNR